METRLVRDETERIVNCIKACQQSEIIEAFRLLREEVSQRRLYVLFEDSLNCDVRTDHLKPKNVLPIYEKYFEQAETYLLQVPFAKEQQAVTEIVAEANNDLSAEHAFLKSRSQQFSALFDSATAIVGELEKMIISLAAEKGKDKNVLLGEISFLKEELLSKKNISAEYKPDFSEILEPEISAELELPERNEKLVMEKETAVRNAARMSKQLIELQEMQENSRKEIDNLREMLKEYDNMKETYDNLLERLEEKEIDLQDTNELLISARESITELNRELELQNGEINSLDFELRGEASLASAETQRIIQEKDLEIAAKEESIESLQDEYEQINASCVELERQLQDVRFANQQYGKTLKAAEDEKKSLFNKIEQLQDEISNTQEPEIENTTEGDPSELKEQQIQRKLAEMQREKEEQIETELRRLSEIESEAFELITGMKAAPQDFPQLLCEKFWAKHEKTLRDEQEKAIINNEIAKLRTSSASSIGNDSYVEDLPRVPSGAVADDKAFKKMLSKCPELVEQRYEEHQSELEKLKQQLENSQTQAEVLEEGIDDKVDGTPQKLESNSAVEAEEEALATEMAANYRFTREELLLLKEQLEEENHRFNDACSTGRLDDAEISEMVTEERALVDKFNAELTELAAMDISIIDRVEAEIFRQEAHEMREKMPMALEAETIEQNKATETSTSWKPLDKTPKTTLEMESTLECRDAIESEPSSLPKPPDGQGNQALAHQNLNPSELRLSQMEDEVEDTDELLHMSYEPRLSIEELATHYDTIGLGYNASGRQMLLSNQYEKWETQMSAINNMLYERGIPAVSRGSNLLDALEEKKTEIKQFYNNRKIAYDRKAVIKTLRGAANMIDSLMIINSGGQRRFYTFLGTKLVRTMGSSKETRSLSEGTMINRQPNYSRLEESNQPRHLKATEYSRPSVGHGLPFLNHRE